MTMHMAESHFSISSKPQIEVGFHPLANPHVLQVVPFWMGSEEQAGDLVNRTQLFNEDHIMEPEVLLHLHPSMVRNDHGEEVAEALEGRTGLYVVVDNIEAVRRGVIGTALSDGLTSDDVAEYVIETLAGIIIFAEKRQQAEHVLAA